MLSGCIKGTDRLHSALFKACDVLRHLKDIGSFHCKKHTQLNNPSELAVLKTPASHSLCSSSDASASTCLASVPIPF